MATIGFKAAGEAIYLIGSEPWATPHQERGHLGQSLWLREIHGREEGDAPHVDLTLEKNSGEFVRELIAAGLVSAVHDVSDGGLAIALAEMALASGLGAETMAHEGYSPAEWWFGEDQGRYVVTVPDLDAFQRQIAKGTRNADTASSGLRRIGTVGGDKPVRRAPRRPAHRAQKLLSRLDGKLSALVGAQQLSIEPIFPRGC